MFLKEIKPKKKKKLTEATHTTKMQSVIYRRKARHGAALAAGRRRGAARAGVQGDQQLGMRALHEK